MARILVIDDDGAMRTFLTTILADAGHDVAPAPDGEAGLALFHSQPADLVVTDIEMPRKDGFDVMLDLRRRDPRPPVIAISGGSFLTDPYLEMAHLLGAAATLEKPFTAHQFLAAVAQALGAATMQNQCL